MEWSAPGYTEIRQLGAGASGRVALAVHDATGVEVAIKYLSGKLLREPAALARFQSEARLLTTLRDPHIATMLEYIQDARGAAIVMELVNGVSLRALLRENGTTGPEAALVVLKGSLLGLARAHAMGLVHRDYKPENVIVRDDGLSKLVDFGIAVRQGSASRPEGTPPYMAPELWEGRPSSPATDVYAATAVFFECLTGHRPYRSTEPVVLGYQHLHAPVPVQDAPEPVRGLIRAGLAKDPALRPASALEFVAELEATARAAYGEDWEERGRRRLAALVALLALLLPKPQTPGAEVTTSLARTVFRGMRANARKLAMGGAVAAAAAVAVVVLINRPTPVEEAAAVAAPPSEIAAPPAVPSGAGETPEAASSPEPDEPEPSGSDITVPEPGTRSTAPEPESGTPSTVPESGTPSTVPESGTPSTVPESATESAVPEPARPEPSGGEPEGTPQAEPQTPPGTRPSQRPRPEESATGPGPATLRPAEPRTTTPAPGGDRTPDAPTDRPTATGDPAPPATSVLGLTLGRITVGSDGVARSTLTLRTSGTGPVTATAVWSASGADGRTERVRLSGARFYARTLAWRMGEQPCGTTVSLAVTTSPAAFGGPRTARVSVPPCPARVTALNVSLGLPAAPARTATARIKVTASGRGAIPVRAGFAVDGEPAGTRTAQLSGRTSYSRAFTLALRSRPCGSTLSVQVTAGGRTATARASVPCPAQVRRVAIVEAGVYGGVQAQVRVTTASTQPVRLTVRFAAGASRDSRTVTLSGGTSYSRAFRFPARMPCGTRWSITALTDPAAAGGADTRTGTTPACPRDDEPDPQGSPSPGTPAKNPPIVKTPSEEPPPVAKTPAEQTASEAPRPR
ncbi:protein kinase [Nonomuraea sp. NPDC052634]|uniref:protein kinase domain-containing protein n=1 Tax=Nonomuraea sp. NPDC052634 TaxID=3155813 RepID=UPI0034452066